MVYKEHMGSEMSSTVKPEPQEVKIEPLAASLSYNSSQSGLGTLSNVNVKSEISLNPIRHSISFPKTDDANVPVLSQPARPTYFIPHVLAAEISYTPEIALKQGLGMVKELDAAIKSLDLSSKMRQDVWMREIESLKTESSPSTLVAVCGATGAGKSSILNAVLNDNIVPTSGMRACTAVVTEISYHNKPTIEGDVSFLSRTEWTQELTVLLTDLVEEDGNIKRASDLKSDAGVAWSKVHAVYPMISQQDIIGMKAEQIIASQPAVEQILGTTRKIIAKDSKEFAKTIAQYIDSKDQSRGKKDKKKDKGAEKPKEPSLMDTVRAAAGKSNRNVDNASASHKNGEDTPALWPLIRQVSVRCNSEALSTGACLVDLPGVADANLARNNIAKDYMKKCNCIWILAPITRAVDDKTARDLLGDAFRFQLMNGNYDAHTITFIASKCDDISCSEVIRALDLEDDPVLEEIQSRIDVNTSSTLEKRELKAELERSIEDTEEKLESIKASLEEYENHLEALQKGEIFVQTLTGKTAIKQSKKRKNCRGGKKGSSKRRRASPPSDSEHYGSGSESENNDSGSDSDSDARSNQESHQEYFPADGEEEVSEVRLKCHISQCEDDVKNTRTELSEFRKLRKENKDSLHVFTAEAKQLQREKSSFAAIKRSEFSKDVLKQDFRSRLKDLDDAAAEERDPENFDSSKNIRDYDSIDLPVFTCSSRDYVRLTGQAKGDGESSCFLNVEDTEIPKLQKWCHELTFSSRDRSARNYLTHLKTFATSVEAYVQGIGDVTSVDREALRVQWESSANLIDHAQGYEEDGDGSGKNSEGEDWLPAQNGAYRMTSPALHNNNMNGVAPRLAKGFSEIVDKSVDEMKQYFMDGLDARCREGARNAAASAVETSNEFAQSMHWGTYRASKPFVSSHMTHPEIAALRRHGCWRRDLNAELLVPFTKNIAAAWGQVFETNLFASFEKKTIDTIARLICAVEESATGGLKDRIKAQGDLSFEEAKVSLRQTINLVRETLQSQQKEISRCLEPTVKAQMVEAYDNAMLEKGIGSVARQKAYIHDFLEERKNEIFSDGAEVLLDGLNAAAVMVGQTLDGALERLAEKVEVNLAVLWERTTDHPEQVEIYARAMQTINIVNNEIALFKEAEKNLEGLYDGNEEVGKLVR